LNQCIFCKIIAGQAPAKILFQDDRVTAFRDSHPVAPTHVLVVPNRHITSLNDVSEAEEPLLGHLLIVARQIATEEEIDEGGYRLILNTGAHARQSVFHLHLHVIGGQPVRYPMG
jgi:histidine triad (HIT) family protein